MARSHRRSGSARADWVYRGYKFMLDEQGTQETLLSGTYYNPISMAAGDQTGQVLYDSTNYINSRRASDLDSVSGSPVWMAVPAPARPDQVGRGPLIHGVELGIYGRVEDAFWSGNAVCYLGWRIVVAPQDPTTGRMFIDPGYSMWQNFTGFETGEPVFWANGRSNCAEGRFFRTRKTTDVRMEFFIHRPFIRFKRRLNADEGLYLYLEVHPNSTGISPVNLWCRTLVTDDSGG